MLRGIAIDSHVTVTVRTSRQAGEKNYVCLYKMMPREARPKNNVCLQKTMPREARPEKLCMIVEDVTESQPKNYVCPQKKIGAPSKRKSVRGIPAKKDPLQRND